MTDTRTMPAQAAPDVATRQRAHAFALFRKVAFGDLLLLFYVAGFARQYFWAVDNQFLAWALTTIATVAAWGFYLWAKDEDDAGLPRAFWLVVALPLAFVYLMRAPFIDVSFDVLNYRLQHAERALRGFLLLAGDFFPTPAPYNPAPDIVTGLFRHALGYRLGTIVNLLAMLWAAAIVERLLREYVPRAVLRCACVLLVVFTEQCLFEINNYYVDLLPLPLLLEAARLATKQRADNDNSRLARDATVAAFMLGAAVGFKFANVAFAVPIALAFAYNARGANLRSLLKSLALGVSAFAAPLVPFTIYIYGETGNPVFPLYNAVFESPYWPAINTLDPRWGPKTIWETLAWPVIVFFKPERFSEVAAYAGRISLGYAASIICLLLARRDARVRLLAFICLLSCLLWSAGSGYVRYALFAEMLGGVLVVWLLARLASATGPAPLRFAPRVALGALLVAQFAGACYYILKYEWAMRPTIFQRPGAWKDEARYFLRDRDLRDFVPADDLKQIDAAEAWIESAHKSNAFEALLKPEAPILTVRTNQFFVSPQARRKFNATLAAHEGRRLYSLVMVDALPAARREIESKGLRVGQVTPVMLPFFSPTARVPLALIEVLPREREERAASPTGERRASKAAPLPLDGFDARLTVASPPSELQAGQKAALRVTVKNQSSAVWRAGLESEWAMRITLADRWLDAEGRRVVNDLDGRAVLPFDLAPGEEAELTLEVTAPKQPGEYTLEFDMVQEGVAFFRERGSEPAAFKVKVR